jgi:nucleotide-binding universal stress UspA family protein
MKVTRNMRILCPIDFDVNSLAALDLARDLVQEYGGQLYVLHVVPPANAAVLPAMWLVERARHFAQIRLDEIARESLGGIDHFLLIRIGSSPAEEILGAANELEVQIVAMATHGQTNGSRFALGSVAETVIRESRCPVLTIAETTKYASARWTLHAESRAGP